MQVTVVALRRYPVKSMGGERLEVARLNDRGIEGDRWFAVSDDAGHFASGKNTRRFRRRDAVFDYSAATAASGEVAVTGATGVWAVGDPVLDDELSQAMGLRVRVTSERDVPHQDMGAVSLVSTATLDWCAARWGIDADPRRLRVNILVHGEEPFVEETWTGQTIRFGEAAALRVVTRAPRCRMIDVAQDGAGAQGRWLKPLTRERDMCLAMYAGVAVPGTIASVTA